MEIITKEIIDESLFDFLNTFKISNNKIKVTKKMLDFAFNGYDVFTQMIKIGTLIIETYKHFDKEGFNYEDKYSKYDYIKKDYGIQNNTNLKDVYERKLKNLLILFHRTNIKHYEDFAENDEWYQIFKDENWRDNIKGGV